MKKLPSLLLITVFIFLILTVPASANTIDFENMPETYWEFSPTGNQNIGNYFSGVTFGPQATILEDQVYGYNTEYQPPNSGNAVMSTDGSQGDAIQADFNVPTNDVSLYYTSATGFFLEAYDSLGTQIASVSSDLMGNNIFLQVTSSGYNIAYVIMHDGGNFYTVDDFSFNVPVPEPSTMLLLGSGLIGLLGLRKKFRK